MGKNNYHLKNIKEGTKVESYSIKKFKVGAASVVIGASIFFGAGAVAQASESVSNNTVTDESLRTEKKLEVAPKAQAKPVVENTRESVSAALASKLENSEKETLNKVALTKLIEEIDGKFTNGKYTSKTEDSVNQLKVALEEARTVLNNAKTQAELSQAQAKLITATTKLQTKPEEKKEAPAVDTTNGKDTVGIKATNTEKASDSNSIANSGSKDERNGKALDANNPFRTDAATTDTDPTANQTYTAPAENADLTTLADKLKNLSNVIENNKKVQDMDTLGNALNVDKGSVKEINEFGGWKAVGDTGKFAIARKTEAGVFPAYTVNINRTNQVWVREQSFDRNSDYILLLSKLVTKQNRDEPVYDNKPYLENNEPGAQTARSAKWFDGIEKTFKAYATNEGTKVTVSFKTGYTGDNNGSKAKYKVEVFSIENDTEKSIYTAVVSPETTVNNSEMKVVAAKDGNARNETFNASGFTKEKIEEKLALPENRPNATGGTFTSREIDLPKGVTSYKVRISLENKHQAGMSYNSTYLQYSLPITGSDFNVNQDTSVIAKNLLSRIYDKLKATETEDTDGKTNDTKAAYLAELENINTLITSTDVKKTAEYKQALESILSKHLALEVDKTALTDSKTSLDDLVKEDPTPGKTQDTATAYNTAKQEAIKAIDAAKKVIANTDATVAQVREALNKVNEKKAALESAKQALVEVATTEEKAKLKTDADSLVKADTNGKTPNSIEAYNTKYEQLKAQLEEAKAAAAAVEAKGNNATKEEAKAAQTKVDAAKAELTKAAELLVNKADKAELTKAKDALNTLATEADPTPGKTADSAKAYTDAKTAAQQAIQAAETVINDGNATQDQVTEALNKVNEKKAALESAKQALVEVATTEEKAKLKTDADSLVKADTNGKTPNSIEAYNTKYEQLKAQLEEAKAAAAAVEAKGNNATKEEAKAAQTKVDAAKAELTKAAELLVNKADKAELTKAKDALNTLATEADPTPGKTADSAKTYNDAKTAAQQAIQAAETVINDGNATQDQVTEALNKVNEKKAALESAKQALVEVATTEEKAKLKTDADSLVKADTNGKTPNSIEAYNTKYEQLKAQLEEAKAAAAAVEAKGNNATKEEAKAAQTKVDAAKAELTKAAELLVNKADKAELTKAKDALNTLATEADPTPGKTADSAKAYTDAKTAAQQAIQAAETVINDGNATQDQVTEALNKVNEKKAALESAKQALVEVATTEEKAKLKTDADSLVKADTNGKTPNSIEAYNTKYEQLKAQLEEAKAAAAAVEAKGNNATKEEAKAAQTKVDAAKAELTKAAELLVNKADKAELTKAKDALNTLATEADPTPGKTADSAKAYTDAKTAAQQAIQAAETVINDGNATQDQVTEALNKVNEKKAALESAKQALVEVATTEEKAKLKTDADSLVKADTNGKTPNSIEAYNTKYEQLKAQLEEAKAAAAAVEAKGNNATKEEAKAAQTKVDAAKAELTKAAELLVNKADKAELTKAKDALNTLATEADPTPGKTADSAKTYNDAKTAAQQAIQAAETVINDGNATQDQVTEALNKVNEKKAALESAKQALVEVATTEEKAKLKTDADSLVKADTNGKTPNSIEAYNTKYEQLKAQLEEAKAAAAAVEAKGNNATKEEAKAAQTKVDAAKAELTKAAELLVNKADKAELTKAKDALNTLATEADPTPGKTADSAKAYTDAKTAAQQAIQAAETVINDGNATQDQVTEALNKVNEKKAALESAKQALVEVATTEEKAKLKTDADSLVKADTNGKTPNSIEAYNTKYEQLKAQLEEAKAAAAAVEAKGNNATKEEAKAAQTKVDAAKAELTKAAELLVNKADKAELTKAKDALNTLATEADPTPGKTADSAKTYNDAKTAAQQAIQAAETVINDGNATQDQVTEALNKVNEKKAALESAKQALVEVATTEEKAKLKTDADSLVKADTNGKTPNSIEAYNTKYEQLKAQLEEAKAAAAAVEAKGNNATKEEAKAAQTKVDAAKAELTKAAELLVNKADKAELTKAKDALNTLATEADPTPGKTADSAKTYNDAKTAAQQAIQAAETVINDGNATQDQVTEALNKVNEKKAALESAKQALVEVATTEEKAKLKTDADSLVKADTNGKTPNSIEAYNTKYEQLKAQLEEAKAAAAAVEAKGNNATKEEAKAAQTKVDAAKAELTKAAELLKDLDRDAAKKEIADAAKKATDAIEASTSLTPEQKAEEKAKVAKEAKAAIDTIDNATTEEGINSAKENGKLAIEKEVAKAEIDAALAEKEKAIEANNKLSDAEKQAAKAEAKKAADEAKKAIAEAKDQAGVDAKVAEGKAAIAAVNPVGKEKAQAELDAILAEKEKAIDANNKLSDAEKQAAKAEAKKAADEAKKAIAEAKDQAGVDVKVAEGKAAIAAVNPVGKEKAQAEIDAALAEKEKAIEANNKLSDAEKQAAKAEAKKAADEAKKAIAEAKDQAGVDAKVAEGKAAIAAVNPVGKEKAQAEIDAALAEKEKAIDANNKLSDAEKQAAKAEAKKAADEAKKAIAEAKDQAGVDAKVAEGKAAIAAVNPVGKEKAQAEIDVALAEKEKAIEANNKLSDAEKRAAKAEAKKVADEAKKAIAEAKDQAGVDAKAAEGKAAIAAVNPVGKDKAQAEIDAALAEKEKAIEANNKLSDAEKQAAKAEAKKVADEAKKAIAEAKDQAGVDAKVAEGKAAIAAVNPVGKDKAKAEVEGELAKKLAELENSTDLTDAEKATAKARVLDEAKKAIEAIEKAMTQAEVDQVIRNFIYHISAVVLEKEEYDLSKLFVNGSVIVKQGEALADKDILSKLNLPEGVEVVKVEKPETVALGEGTAKVTLKLADGTQVTITVPVEVVEGSTTSGITKLSSEVVKTGETEESSNKDSNKQLPNTGTTETNTGLVGLGLGILGLLAATRRRKEK